MRSVSLHWPKRNYVFEMKKCMKIVFCFLVHGRLFFMFFQPFLRMPALNATDEIWHLATAIVNVFVVWMIVPIFPLASVCTCSSLTSGHLTAYSVRSYSTRGNVAQQLINIDRCRSPCNFNSRSIKLCIIKSIIPKIINHLNWIWQFILVFSFLKGQKIIF